MDGRSVALWLLEMEARSLMTRLARLKPFALITPMVPAAAVSPAAQTAIENHMIRGRSKLRGLVHGFLQWLRTPEGRNAPLPDAQRRLVFLRLRFNAVISQFYIFSDVLTQRSAYENGVWVAGLDDVAEDALRLPGNFYNVPPVVCYLDRGHGGAIRRARTRLPGGEPSPVAIIRIPQERMIGSGIASSLVHETGHQASSLLDLISSLRVELHARQKAGGQNILAWRLWDRWISEIISDFWGVAKVGVASTLGLIGLVSLPRVFVFRVDVDDPHPAPWIRVKLSCAMGDALYPHPQWKALAQLWDSFYPLTDVKPQARTVLEQLQASIPEFVGVLLNHRPKALQGKSLREVMPLQERQPAQLAAFYEAWRRSPEQMQAARPTLAFAVIGQARADGKITPEVESQTLAQLLTFWAMRSALDTSAICAAQPRLRLQQPALPLGSRVNFAA
jgi:hypothetical protein